MTLSLVTTSLSLGQALSVRSIRLLTKSPQNVQSLQEAGIHISGTHPLVVDPGTDERLRRRYAEKIQQGHRIPPAYT